MPRGNPVPVMGVWLRRIGDHVIVSVETVDGRDVEVIREHHDGSFSHNVSEHGIAGCIHRDEVAAPQLLSQSGKGKEIQKDFGSERNPS